MAAPRGTDPAGLDCPWWLVALARRALQNAGEGDEPAQGGGPECWALGGTGHLEQLGRPLDVAPLSLLRLEPALNTGRSIATISKSREDGTPASRATCSATPCRFYTPAGQTYGAAATEVMATAGGDEPSDPWNATSPKAKIPPSAATMR